MEVLILGAGYTGARVAALMLAHGVRVYATTSNPGRIAKLNGQGAVVLEDLAEVPDGVRVLHSIPLVRDADGTLRDTTPELLSKLGAKPTRIVYLSTTGVYGTAHFVDETTATDAHTPREALRLEAEQAVASGPWSHMILRPAAIYGPWRGVHASMREGKFQLSGDGDNYISRIHVDDLAALAAAALLSDAGGAWPVGDDDPCPSSEIAQFCADLMQLPMPAKVPRKALSETRQSNRRVDGRAVRKLLGVELRYPSYKIGIPAALAEEVAGLTA